MPSYEWAYALGKGKSLIPLRLGECHVHPKLETVQYLDFSVPGGLPWESLVERIQEVEVDQNATLRDTPGAAPVPSDPVAGAILNYLNQRGYQMVSFDRLRRRIDPDLTDEKLSDLVARNPALFRRAVLKNSVPGLAKVLP